MRLDEITDIRPMLQVLVQQLLDKNIPIFFNVVARGHVALSSIGPDSNGNHDAELKNGKVFLIAGPEKNGFIYFHSRYGSWVGVPAAKADDLLTLNKREDGWELTNATE